MASRLASCSPRAIAIRDCYYGTVRHHRGGGRSALSRVSVCRVEEGAQAGMIMRLPVTDPWLLCLSVCLSVCGLQSAC